MASGFCRLDRLGGSGLAAEQSLARWAFVAFRSCFSVGIGERVTQPNQTMKPTPRCDTSLAFLPPHPVVAYLFLVSLQQRV
jgi:hypothetical protein